VRSSTFTTWMLMALPDLQPLHQCACARGEEQASLDSVGVSTGLLRC
jgi:hypothetical protein